MSWMATHVYRLTRHLLLCGFLMKLKTKSKRIQKCTRRDTWKKKWKSTFRACEINSLFQFGSMDILIFYALRATYVRCVNA